MTGKPLIFLPALHPELVSGVPEWAMGRLCFMSPGLSESMDGCGGVRRYVSPHLVFNPRQAAACLRDLIAFQSEAGGDAVSAARQIADGFWGALSPLESSELKMFVSRGGSLSDDNSFDFSGLRREVYEQAQKNLLLAWSQEENILEIRRLLQKLGQASTELSQSLSEPVSDNLERSGTDAEVGQSASINGMVQLIMQESGFSSEDLQIQWPAVLIGTICLTEPQTCCFTTRAHLKRLLVGMGVEETAWPPIEKISSGQLENLFPGADAARNLVQCRITCDLLLSAYNSPLLERLLWLDGDVRRELIFIFEENEQL